jgi:serine/threonine protein kinase
MVVLYCRRDKAWKITDFGISAAGSDRAQTTQNARGTSGYRAPELLTRAKATFTNKADIWAIGCILYHLVFGKQLFDDDWTAREWTISKEPLPWWLIADLEYWVESVYWTFLDSVICAMLTPEPHKRPSASGLLAIFNAACLSSNYQLPTGDYLMQSLFTGSQSEKITAKAENL